MIEKTVAEDSGASPIDVLANDLNGDGGPLQITAASEPDHGTVEVNGAGTSLSYSPDADYCNTGEPTDDFTYTLNGGSEAQVTVRVDCADDNPSAVDDQKTVAEDSGASPIDVLANDLNGDGGPLQITAASEPDHGTVEVNGAGTSLSYSPDADYCNTGEPTDDFTYTLNGGSEAQVTVRVDCADDNPSAVDDQKTVAEDSGASPIDVLANDLNGDGGPLQITAASEPDHGTVEVNGAGTSLSYSPDADYCNTGEPTDDFTYTLNGGSEAQVTVRVDCADDNPSAVDDQKTVAEDSGASPIDVLANDLNGDGGPLQITAASEPDHGTVEVNGAGTSLSYSPDADYCNTGEPTDDFTYTLNGGSEAQVTVRVDCADDNPSAVDDQKTVAEDSGASPIDVLANDLNGDGGPLQITAASEPDHGTVEVNGAGTSLSYSPDADYCNTGEPTDDFTYTLNGGSEAQVTVRVDCADDNPSAVDDQKTVAEDSGASPIDVLANDLNGDGGPLQITAASEPDHGTVEVNGAGTSLSYSPDADYCNTGEPTDDFTYTLNGGSEAQVTVRVDCADDNPSAVDDQKTVAEDSGASPIDVLANDLNGDGGPLQITAASEPDHGTVEVNGAGTSLSYSPDADYCNTGEPTDDFTYTLNGGSEAQVTVRVDCADDNPSAVDDQKTVAEDSGASPIDVLANDLNGDGGPLQITAASEPDHGTVEVNGAGTSLSYSPDADYCNTGEPTDDFTYTLNGGSEAQVTVRVDCADDNPSAVDDQKTVAEDSGQARSTFSPTT